MDIMKSKATVLWVVFFYGACVIAAVAVFERLANLFNYTLLRGLIAPPRLLELAGIGLLIAIATQLHQIRELLNKKTE